MKIKKKLEWQAAQVANIFDEVTLWSAPFGRLLLDHIPMKPESKTLDIGFGTGFPLIELSQRFDPKSTIYGIDIWEEGIRRCREKIKTLELSNIEIFTQSAVEIPLPDGIIDLVTSNLGVNNFSEKERVFAEINRVMKPGASLCLTTNPMGTFAEFFVLCEEVIAETGEEDLKKAWQLYLRHRGTEASIIAEIESEGFVCQKKVRDQTQMRFVNGLAVFNHSLIRIGFMESWEAMIPANQQSDFFKQVIGKMDRIIEQKGEFRMSVPLLYLEFAKV